jgi:hypothetical protein
MGLVGTDHIEEFVGSYYGLMFHDPEGGYYSTDVGSVIKKLDFGVMIASQTSLTKEVKLTNNTSINLTNVIISSPDIFKTNIYIQLSDVDVPFNPKTNLNLGTLAVNETKTFYVRILTVKTSYGSGDFDITVYGDPV